MVYVKLLVKMLLFVWMVCMRLLSYHVPTAAGPPPFYFKAPPTSLARAFRYMRILEDMHALFLYDRGYSLYRTPLAYYSHRGGGKRGKLTGKASSASFRRLREWCIKHDISCDCWGITLTIPGLDVIDVNSFKRLHHKLCVWCNDNDIPLVWRVELQQRGQPHLHCVLFGSVVSSMRLLIHWYKLLQSLPKVYSLETVGKKQNDVCLVSRAFVRGSVHAVDLQQLSGDFRAWRYLVAHMSKSKIVQLGWQGRNWGVCNRNLFDDVIPDCFDLNEREFFALRRWISRLTMGVPCKRKGKRCNKFLEQKKIVKKKQNKRVKDIEFRTRRKMVNRTCSFWLGNPVIIRQMLLFVKRCPPNPF